MKPAVSIIIPHLNQPEALARCLESLVAQQCSEGSLEIIVVDNGSRTSPACLAPRFPEIRWLSESEPGPGLARNCGVKAAMADRLLFIDADCRAHPHWVQAALAGLAAAGSKAVCGGDVRIDVTDPAKLSAIEAYESIFAYRQQQYIAREGFSGTGNLAMHRSVFDAVGPFGGIGIAEDRDWGQRALALGFVTHYVSDMIIYHPARRDFAELTEKWRRHIAHDLARYRSRGQSATGWHIRALLMIMSIVPHGLSVLVSPRLHGARSRVLAIATLARIRLFRCREMWRQNREQRNAAADWNR
jgi:glycosyltransferase involved in cell wall biosynthesis